MTLKVKQKLEIDADGAQAGPVAQRQDGEDSRTMFWPEVFLGGQPIP